MGCTYTDEKIRAAHIKHEFHAQFSWSPENGAIKRSGIERVSHGGVIEVAVNEKSLRAKERRFLIRRLAYEKAPGWSQQDMGGTFILFIFLMI